MRLGRFRTMNNMTPIQPTVVRQDLLHSVMNERTDLDGSGARTQFGFLVLSLQLAGTMDDRPHQFHQRPLSVCDKYCSVTEG